MNIYQKETIEYKYNFPHNYIFNSTFSGFYSISSVIFYSFLLCFLSKV